MGKTYLITGGTSGIGKSIVNEILKQLSSEDKVIVNYGHDDKKANLFYDSLNAKYKKQIFLVKSNLSDYIELKKFVKNIEMFGEIDYLISNIGISEYAKFDDYTIDMWNRVMDTNLTMPVFLVKELKYKIKKGGSILFMGSYAGKQEYSSSVVYSISKAGIIFLAKVLVKEFHERNVRVNALAPGFIETPWQNGRSNASRERINNKIALHRFGKTSEVAEMAVAILHNGYMNGAIVDIHGGYDFF